MNTMEDRARTAMRAIAGTVNHAPPLRLPRRHADSPAAPARRRSGWRLWIAPLAAFAAVIAVGIALVIIRGTREGRPASPVSPAPSPVSPAAPEYYVAVDQVGDSLSHRAKLVVGDTFSGARLATLSPPQGGKFTGVTGAADDRTFVVDTQQVPLGQQNAPYQPRTWYLLRLSPGSASPARLTKLPIPPTQVGTNVRGIVLSPDGTKLAVILQPGALDNSHAPVLLRLYSVATGAVLRTWSTTASDSVPGGQTAQYTGWDANLTVSWVDGGRALAFGAYTPRTSNAAGGAYIMLLDTSLPGGDLLANSRPAVTLKTSRWPVSLLGCGTLALSDVLVTADGKSLVCGGTGASAWRQPLRGDCSSGPAWNHVAFLAYSLATGRQQRILGEYETTCFGPVVQVYPLWVNASGSEVLGYLNLGEADPFAENVKAGGEFGMVSKGKFTKLPLPSIGRDFLLGDIAW
jgi:hypothetical protein